MSRKNLPPLQVNTEYRLQDFEYLEFATQEAWRRHTGEDTAILRLHLSNATRLEIPLLDEALKHHMRLLMEAYPTDAIDHICERWPNEVTRKEQA